jgi:hypothetical protein
MSNSEHLGNSIRKQAKDQPLNQLRNTSKMLNEAIATGNADDIYESNKAHSNAMKKLVADCPYCDPNWDDVPNFPEAMKGYDVPMGNPDPGNSLFIMVTIG